MSSVTLGNIIGRGSYGKVYSCRTEDGRDLAAKIVPCNKLTGATELVEASIMRTYDHPNIAKSICVKTESNNMYIFQELAVSDMAFYCSNNATTHEELRRWSFSMVQSLWVLHTEGIIHCDVKPANILKYKDNRIALADYTFSVITTNKGDMFTHPISTLNYRCPEAMAGMPWGMSSDIWSMGCSLYEMSTGEMLIPHQGSKISGNYMSGTGKAILKDKTYNSVIEWSISRGNKIAASRFRNVDTDIVKVSYSQKFLQMPPSFRELVYSMTEFDPSKRPTAEELLQHPFFKGMKTTCYHIKSSPVLDIEGKVHKYIEMLAAKYDCQSEVLDKSIELYRRTKEMKDAKSHQHILGCIWIAHKLLTGGCMYLKEIPNTQIVGVEKMICDFLGYRLHIPGK